MAAPFDVRAAAVVPWTVPAEHGPSPFPGWHSRPPGARMEGQLASADTRRRTIGRREPRPRADPSAPAGASKGSRDRGTWRTDRDAGPPRPGTRRRAAPPPAPGGRAPGWA